MKVFYSYGFILSVLLTITADVHCDEDPGLSTIPNTTPEFAEPSILPESDTPSTLPESITLSNLPESAEPSIFPESDAPSTLPESTTLSNLPESAESTTLPFVGLSSAPGWWLGPAQFVNTSAGEGESKNGMLSNENGSSHEEWTFPPLIIIRYPLEGPPEILIGSFTQENGTYEFESENGNSTRENEFDVNDFNVTEFPFFPVEGGMEEEITFDTPNGTEVWIDDFFVIPDENVTEATENKTGEAETVGMTAKGNEKIETTILPTGDISDATEVSSLAESQESTTLASDMENALPV